MIERKGGEWNFLLNERYQGLPEKLRDPLVFLHLAGLLTEISLLPPEADSLVPDFNRKLASLLAQTLVYLKLTPEEREALAESHPLLDSPEFEFRKLLDLMKSFPDKESLLKEESRETFINFLSSYPGFDKKDYDANKVDASLKSLFPDPPRVSARKAWTSQAIGM